MTRESKLALIIGFVLILVVGVLVSDHLSQASSEVIDPNSGLDDYQPVVQLPTEQQQQTKLETTITAKMPTEQNTTPRFDDGPVIISQGSTRNDSLLEQMVNEISNLDPQSLVAEEHRNLPNEPARTYIVASGDSLYAIARKSLGDGDRWAEIHRLNMRLLGPDPVLQPGMKLLLPGNAIVTESARTTRRTQPQTPRTSAPKTYTVVSGDVLSMISQQLLGTSKRAEEIASLNGLDDVDDIRVGMVLKIPAR